MLDRLSPARRNLALAALFLLVLWFAWTVRAALNPLMLGLLFAYILHPMVIKLERRGWSRQRAVNVIFCAVGVVVVLLGFALVMQARALWRDVSRDGGSIDRLQRQLTEIADSAEARVEEFGVSLRALQGIPEGPVPSADEGAQPLPAPQPAEQHTLVNELFERTRRWVFSEEARTGAAEAGLRAAGGVWGTLESVFGSILSILTLLFLVPLYTWFLLFELERVSSFVRAYIPRDQRELWTRIGGQMAEMLGSFFRGRLLVCLLKGLLLTAALAALGVPYALLTGMLAGFLSLIPFVGPGLGYLMAFLLALLVHEPASAAWRVGVVFAIGELGEGYVLMPRVLGERLGLHPVVVLASLMIFGSALGMFGLLLALPLTAALVILARELVLPALRQWAEGRGAKAAR